MSLLSLVLSSVDHGLLEVNQPILVAPMLWAMGLAWATTDPRLLRVGAGLGALAAAGGVAAWL